MDSRGIGEVATHLGLDVDTLRWFERQGVVPQPERDSGGRRRYTESDVHVLGAAAPARHRDAADSGRGLHGLGGPRTTST